MSIRIITHCYAKELPQYATFLHYQLSSLVLYKPEVSVVIYVCCTLDDQRTVNVLRQFQQEHPQLDLRPLYMSPGQLFRRSIGRNVASLTGTEALMWFTDVDHCFGAGCLDTLWDQWLQFDAMPTLMYPGQIWICRDHATGDALIGDVQHGELKDVENIPFTVKKYNRAIGGIQIVNGDYIREYGYLHRVEKWQRPRTDHKPFGDFRDDIAFRKLCAEHGIVQRITLPHLYRLRHTATTYQ